MDKVKYKYYLLNFSISIFWLFISYVCFGKSGFDNFLGIIITLPSILIFGAGYAGGKSASILATVIVFCILWGFISLISKAIRIYPK